MRILLVEDDKKISKHLEQGLKESGYAVDCAFDGLEGHEFIQAYTYDLVIMDVMLPKLDGLLLVEKVRNQGLRMPVLLLSAKRSVDDRVKGLQMGGDDYLTKPFSFNELLARVQALLRRASPNIQPAQSTKLQSGDILFDLLARKVTRAGQPIDLQAKELSLLELFLRNPGRVLTKTQILENIWNYQFDPQTNVVDVLVFRLRAKVDRGFDKKVIQTIRGVGYVFQPN